MEEVQAVGVRPRLQHRQQDATGATGDVKHRALRLARQVDVKLDAVLEARADHVVEIAVVEG